MWNMSCPCGLTKEEVKDFDRRTGLERVPLLGGKCQNPLANGDEGVCGRALGAHPAQTQTAQVQPPPPSIENIHLIGDKSKGMFRCIIYFHHDSYVFCESKGLMMHETNPSIYGLSNSNF